MHWYWVCVLIGAIGSSTIWTIETLAMIRSKDFDDDDAGVIFVGYIVCVIGSFGFIGIGITIGALLFHMFGKKIKLIE